MVGAYASQVADSKKIIPIQRYFFAPWEIDEEWRNLRPGEAVWFELSDESQSIYDVFANDSFSSDSQQEFVEWIMNCRINAREHRMAHRFFIWRWVGPYARVFRLWRKPRLRKLGDWHQLPKGQQMLLSPTENFEEEEQALQRCKFLKYQGAGEFSIHTGADGTIWAKRTSLPPKNSPYLTS